MLLLYVYINRKRDKHILWSNQPSGMVIVHWITNSSAWETDALCDMKCIRLSTSKDAKNMYAAYRYWLIKI